MRMVNWKNQIKVPRDTFPSSLLNYADNEMKLWIHYQAMKTLGFSLYLFPEISHSKLHPTQTNVIHVSSDNVSTPKPLWHLRAFHHCDCAKQKVHQQRKNDSSRKETHATWAADGNRPSTVQLCVAVAVPCVPIVNNHFINIRLAVILCWRAPCACSCVCMCMCEWARR